MNICESEGMRECLRFQSEQNIQLQSDIEAIQINFYKISIIGPPVLPFLFGSPLRSPAQVSFAFPYIFVWPGVYKQLEGFL